MENRLGLLGSHPGTAVVSGVAIKGQHEGPRQCGYGPCIDCSDVAFLVVMCPVVL